jgi:hypothetical protein
VTLFPEKWEIGVIFPVGGLNTVYSYKWFPETFKSDLKRSRVQVALVNCIEDVIEDLKPFMSGDSEGRLSQQRDNLERVKDLFRILDSRSRDANLINHFWKALFTSDPEAVRPMLTDACLEMICAFRANR